ncbi:helix-turn-helix domain-containing protein [Gillisia sp. Q332]|uniref:helix-turn-helix domain-containing protein n=1 Tax=Gillisia xinjiangensis TaxID=3384765 RepID=UPI00391DA32B
MKLFIKNMVGVQCKRKVEKELERLEIPFRFIDAGVVELYHELTLKQRNQFKENLLRCGLKLHEEKKCILIEKIKNAILEMIQYSEKYSVLNYSEYLSKKLNYDYTYLANIFSEVKGVTIQQYIIFNKIERVKELILLDDLNLSGISYKLNYSSVAHLSSQFKKVTGFSPSVYKLLNQKRAALLETF